MRYFILLLILLNATFLFAQPDTLWTRTYGGIGDEYGSGIIARSDGSFMVSGTTNSFGAGASDQYLLHLTANGDSIWTRTIGTAEDEWCTVLTSVTLSQFVMTGYRFNSEIGHREGVVMWVDTLGNRVDSISMNGGTAGDIYFNAACSNGNGGVLVGGAHRGQSYQSAEAIDLLPGTIVQNYFLLDWNFADIRSAARTADGGYILGGYEQATPDSNPDFLLIRLARNQFVPVWSMTYGDSAADEINCVIQTSDGGFAFTGPTDSYGTNGDVALFKTDSAGNVQWFRTFGGDREDHGHIVIQTPDHGYFLAGHTESFGVGGDVIAIKTDSRGNQQWMRHWGGDGMDVAESAALTNDGGYILVGTTTSFGAGSSDLWVLRIASDLATPDPAPAQVSDISLAQNYPNPFNAQTRISFNLSHPQTITLKLFDLQGRFVETLAEGPYSAGPHDLQLNADPMPSGLYFYQISAGGFSDTKKMILLK